LILGTNVNQSHYRPGVAAEGSRNLRFTDLMTTQDGGKVVSLTHRPLMSMEIFTEIKHFRSHYGPGVDTASNRNEYQEYFLGGKGGRCVELTTLPPSCAVVT